jgi:hypothetical protein
MKRFELWGLWGLEIILGISVCIGVVSGTLSSKPYDERTYLLVLSLMAGLVLFYLGQVSEELKKKIKGG